MKRYKIQLMKTKVNMLVSILNFAHKFIRVFLYSLVVCLVCAQARTLLPSLWISTVYLNGLLYWLCYQSINGNFHLYSKWTLRLSAMCEIR